MPSSRMKTRDEQLTRGKDPEAFRARYGDERSGWTLVPMESNVLASKHLSVPLSREKPVKNMTRLWRDSRDDRC